ncbi:MAG: tRNA (adenosine(37)-N6)-threonylcarbamoyltransferase complex ATPase subunit type 1 TsaE [Actinobacteria bacterium]|nr:tRNA (adenosine(37)-N6)-threonylcarbamoyltransferase complex ATPase subunit type 1 TsaE [Actinomycetota bacterium]
MVSLKLVCPSAEETRSVGRALAEILTRGDVVSLTGDLGAGKTTFVQGAADGLGVAEPVLSPTFTLVREYEGRLPVTHMDVYRLDRIQDVLDLGFEELMDPGGILFLEWGDAIESLLPESYLEVELVLAGESEQRSVRMSAQGAAWQRRWRRLEELTTPWAA